MTSVPPPPGQVSTAPLPIPTVLRFGPQVIEAVESLGKGKKVAWLLVLFEADGELVNIGVPADSTAISIDGCTGKVTLFKAEQAYSAEMQPIVSEFPACAHQDNDPVVQDKLRTAAHLSTRLSAISYAAHNTCVNIDGHRFYK